MSGCRVVGSGGDHEFKHVKALGWVQGARTLDHARGKARGSLRLRWIPLQRRAVCVVALLVGLCVTTPTDHAKLHSTCDDASSRSNRLKVDTSSSSSSKVEGPKQFKLREAKRLRGKGLDQNCIVLCCDKARLRWRRWGTLFWQTGSQAEISRSAGVQHENSQPYAMLKTSREFWHCFMPVRPPRKQLRIEEVAKKFRSFRWAAEKPGHCQPHDMHDETSQA